ncbi:MAG TPA: VCBS repeat-containing protein [Methylocystis sp.]|nr:VCBS repeat-containing protein [Methylocystis sp.]
MHRSLGHLAMFFLMLQALLLSATAPAPAQTDDVRYPQTEISPTLPSPEAGVSPESEGASPQALKGWRTQMRRTPPSKHGCYTTTFPSNQWREAPCVKAPELPAMPARRPRPGTVGDGGDVVAVAQSGATISTAVGSFDSVTGVVSETGTYGGANAFTLQLNSNFFPSSACGGNCQGFQQFVYSNIACPHCAYIQYWLIGYGDACPSGWIWYAGDCYTNSYAVSVPAQTIENLANLTLEGRAASGGMDTLIFSTGSALYVVQAPDSNLYLASGWQEAEFNIFGDCCGSQAQFNEGATLVVRVSLDAGVTAPPNCSNRGLTGETNNLSFASAPTPSLGTEPAVVFTESSSGSNNGAPCSAATAIKSGELTDTHDFYGRGKSDILLLDSFGDVGMWAMNGALVVQSSNFVQVPPTSFAVAQRDFNGDGKADILWRDSSGNLTIWFMDGPTALSTAAIGSTTTDWSVVGAGDFNGDGNGDILFRDSNGDVQIWEMNGGSVVNTCTVGTMPTNWSIVGVGDFDGDGKSDILWRAANSPRVRRGSGVSSVNDSGEVMIWFMNGCQIQSAPLIGEISANWSIVGTGDFNGDGYSDILMLNTSGDVQIWEMQGATINKTLSVGSVSSDWSVAETGDYWGAGASGVLWRDSSGDLWVWQLANGPLSNASPVNSPSTGLSVLGAGAD